MKVKIFSFVPSRVVGRIHEHIEKVINEWLERSNYRVVSTSLVVLDNQLLHNTSEGPCSMMAMVYYEEK